MGVLPGSQEDPALRGLRSWALLCGGRGRGALGQRDRSVSLWKQFLGGLHMPCFPNDPKPSRAEPLKGRVVGRTPTAGRCEHGRWAPICSSDQHRATAAPRSGQRNTKWEGVKSQPRDWGKTKHEPPWSLSATEHGATVPPDVKDKARVLRVPMAARHDVWGGTRTGSAFRLTGRPAPTGRLSPVDGVLHHQHLALIPRPLLLLQQERL